MENVLYNSGFFNTYPDDQDNAAAVIVGSTRQDNDSDFPENVKELDFSHCRTSFFQTAA